MISRRTCRQGDKLKGLLARARRYVRPEMMGAALRATWRRPPRLVHSGHVNADVRKPCIEAEVAPGGYGGARLQVTSDGAQRIITQKWSLRNFVE